MNKTKKLVLGCVAGAVAVNGLAAWLLAPGRSTAAQRAPFLRRNYAHRGLYDEAAGIPENSLAAFRAAAAAGYGVELDTRLTADGVVVVAHDNDLTRMTGQNVRVDELSLSQLRELRLQGTAEPVPLFSEVLDVLTAGNVPVIVEVKPVARRDELCRKTLAVMDEHQGDFCVESFDPFTVRWFRRNAPELLRGQLTSQREDLKHWGFALSHCLSNFLCRPQFIAHRVGHKTPAVRLCERWGALRVTWTAHERSSEAVSDAVIFEHFRPPVRY